MFTQSIYEKIDAYLNGTLTGSDLEDFERQLRMNPELANELSLLQNIDTALSDKPIVDFQQIVQEEAETFIQNKPAQQAKTQIISLSVRNLAIAATFLVLVVSIFLLLKNEFSHSASGEELFAQHFETYNLNQSMRSNDIADIDFLSGIQQYQAKNFSDAAQIFKKLDEESQQDMVIKFCLANAYLNQNPAKLDLAKEQFEKIIADDSSIFVPKAKWFTALIDLKAGAPEQAKKLLKEVAQTGDDYGKKAKELLEQLKE